MVISVNTDDPSMFGTSLEKEYRLLEGECGFTREDIRAILLLGIRSSWLPEEEKVTLADSFKADPAWE